MGEKYKVEGYWDCSACGAKGIRGRYRECPNCGKPRGEDVQFYLKEYGEEYALKDDDTSDNPDWFCEYCSSYNPDGAAKCLSCGAERGTRDYSQMRDTETSQLVVDANADGVDDSGQISEEERAKQNYQREREDREKKQREHNEAHGFTSPQPPQSDGKKWKTWQKVLAGVGIFLLISVIAALVLPDEVDIEVKSLHWQRSIQIEQKVTVNESDWSLPEGGRLRDKQREIHHHDHVLDHYEEYYENVSEKVVDHYETITHKKDLGNGKFEIEKTKKPVYKTVTKKEKRKKPVYVDVPVYQTKYYYVIERWKSTRTVDTQGDDKKPYWGDYELAKASGPYGIGEERVAGQTETLTVTGVVKDKEKTYTVEDADWWNSMEVGESIHGLADSDGKLVKDEDE